MRPARSDSLAVIGLAAIAAVCCGLPTVAAALAGAGAGTWLIVHGLLGGFTLGCKTQDREAPVQNPKAELAWV